MNTQELSVAGHSAEFITETDIERKRIKNINTEKQIIERLLDDLDSQMVFYDVGANIGIYTLLACANVANVHAFEPHPYNANRLADNLDLNNYYDDAQIWRVGLYNSSGWSDFNIRRDDPGEGKSHIDYDGDYKIKITRGDDLDIQPPHIIKIDVEGAELKVIEGMRNKLRDSCRIMYIETHPNKMYDRYNDTLDDLRQLISELGFAMKKIYQRGGEMFYRVIKV